MRCSCVYSQGEVRECSGSVEIQTARYQWQTACDSHWKRSYIRRTGETAAASSKTDVRHGNEGQNLERKVNMVVSTLCQATFPCFETTMTGTRSHFTYCLMASWWETTPLMWPQKCGIRGGHMRGDCCSTVLVIICINLWHLAVNVVHILWKVELWKY